MATLDLPDVRLFYEQRGRGPDLVWLAGGDQRGGSWHEWQVPAFEADFRNTTYDARGVGETESRRRPPWPIADYAADCAALVEAVCEPPVFLVGLSMGSLIAQELALSRPELVRCAVQPSAQWRCADATRALRTVLSAHAVNDADHDVGPIWRVGRHLSVIWR